MPDLEIQGDQKNTTIFGLTGPWFLGVVTVVVAGIAAIVWALTDVPASDSSNYGVVPVPTQV